MASVLLHVMNLLNANFKTIPSLLPFLSFAPSAIQTASSLNSTGYLTIRDSRTARSYTLPIINSSIEAMQFMWQSGLKVMDLGLQNTAVGESSITKVDGIRGSIHYRSHSILDLAETQCFESVAFLLIWGHLPSAVELQKFRHALFEAGRPEQVVIDCIASFPRSAPTQTLILAGLAAWASVDHSALPSEMGRDIYSNDIRFIDAKIPRSISALGTIVAMSYCHTNAIPFTYPTAPPAVPSSSSSSSSSSPFVTNILTMMNYVDPTTQRPRPEDVATLSKLWILYADHALTPSTSSFLLTASTLADPLTSASCAIATAYGPLHGGAIDMAYKTIREVGSVENVTTLIGEVVRKEKRLPGYGHRVYRVPDPRVGIIKEMLAQPSLSKRLDGEGNQRDDGFLKVALEIDAQAQQHPYFVKRRLHANADLFGAFVYTALGFPPDIILPLTMISRAVGVMAHWRETMTQPLKLWRPQQVYVGGEDMD